MSAPTIPPVFIETCQIVRNLVANSYDHAEAKALNMLGIIEPLRRPRVSKEMNGSYTVIVTPKYLE